MILSSRKDSEELTQITRDVTPWEGLREQVESKPREWARGFDNNSND